MSAESIFGTAAEQAAVAADVEERVEDQVEEDGLAPIVLASIMYCPSLVAVSIGWSC